MISVRVEQEVADVSPGTFLSCPWSKELNRVTVGLRPATAVLQRFVESPSEIPSSLVVQNCTPRIYIAGAGRSIPCIVPTPFPNIESNAADGINVSGPSNPVMTEDAGLKENANIAPACLAGVSPEAFENHLQLASEFVRNHRVARRRVDAKITSGTNRYHAQRPLIQ
jgi:hypothetical protein